MLPPLLTTTDPERYTQYLQEKISRVRAMLVRELDTSESQMALSEIQRLSPEIAASIPEGYRMRAEFAIYHEDDAHFSYAMFEPHTKPRKMIIIEQFAGCPQAINEAMAKLREYLPQWQVLKHKLFEVDFLCGDHNSVVMTLHYHKKLDEAWSQALEQLRSKLTSLGLNYSFIGRARKQKLVLGDDFVIDTYDTIRGPVRIKHYEATFSQPNSYVCSSMLNFAISCAQEIKAATPAQENDLLELYCGSGTFTMALAPLFTKVLATELDRVPMEAGRYNLQENHINNTKLVRLSAQEVGEALTGVRTFNRLKQQEVELKDYHFSTLLIDPPRSGLKAEESLRFTAQYNHVIYISCSPESLAYDLRYLSRTHEIKRLAFFDQFPYTNHLETGALLSRKSASKAFIPVTISPKDMGLGEEKAQPTYENIRKYVKETHGLTVSALNIAKMKAECGLEMQADRSGDKQQPKCPPEKREAILDAFRHFGMIEDDSSEG